MIINGGYDKNTATTALAEGQGDLAAFGTPFIANPDLVERYQENHPLNTVKSYGLYNGGAEGYIDYPSLVETLTAQAA